MFQRAKVDVQYIYMIYLPLSKWKTFENYSKTHQNSIWEVSIFLTFQNFFEWDIKKREKNKRENFLFNWQVFFLF